MGDLATRCGDNGRGLGSPFHKRALKYSVISFTPRGVSPTLSPDGTLFCGCMIVVSNIKYHACRLPRLIGGRKLFLRKVRICPLSAKSVIPSLANDNATGIGYNLDLPGILLPSPPRASLLHVQMHALTPSPKARPHLSP